VTATTRAAALARYHYTGPFGLAYVELDHRVPFFLCGANTVANLWPEPYDGVRVSTFVHNRKDQLEATTARLVRAGTITQAQAVALFLGDWRVAWCHLVHKPGDGVVCP
jgi:hypothetical protein